MSSQRLTFESDGEAAGLAEAEELVMSALLFVWAGDVLGDVD